MRKIMLSRVQPGMIIAKSVSNADGRFLLAGGTVLTEHYINRMCELGIYSVYIEDSLSENVETPEVLQEKTRFIAISKVKKLFSDVRMNFQFDCEEIQETARAIVTEIMDNKYAMVHLTDIRASDDYTFGHSVNVCVLSVMIGMALGTLDKERLDKLAMGALLHDAGKMMVPNQILNKPGKLTESEWKIMQQHSSYGFELLRKDRNISIVSAHIAFQHHEKINGTGYPRGLSGSQIHEFARIAAIADVYDALTSDRAYSRALLPHQAYEILQAGSNIHFDESILQAFLERIAIYPIGCMVQLNTGDIGIVVKVVPKEAMRPTVRLLISGMGNIYANRPELDLIGKPAMFISRILEEEEFTKVEAVLRNFESSNTE